MKVTYCDRCGRPTDSSKEFFTSVFTLGIVNTHFGPEINGHEVCMECYKEFKKWMRGVK